MDAHRTFSTHVIWAFMAVVLAASPSCNGPIDVEESAFAAAGLESPSKQPMSAPICGDNICNQGPMLALPLYESCSSCPADCGECFCGNGTCDPGESSCSCVQECGGTCCGGTGQACCGGTTCSASNKCVNGVCRHCGNTGEPCCGTSTCVSSNVCVSGTCRHCGYAGEPCCSGNTCSGIGLCYFGTCQSPPCGHLGQVCCSGACYIGHGRCNAYGICSSCGTYMSPCCVFYPNCDPGFSCNPSYNLCM